MNSIYKQLNKIDDNESLNEKWNVKNQRELKKLQESVDKDRAIAWYCDTGTADEEAEDFCPENPDDWNVGNPAFVDRAVDWYTNSYYYMLDADDEEEDETIDESVSLMEAPIGSNDGSELSTTHDAKVVYETVRHIVDNKDSEEYPNSVSEALNHVKRNLKVDIEKNVTHWGYNNVSIKQLISNYTKAIKLIEDNFEGVTKEVAQLRDLLKQLQDKYNQSKR